DAECCVMDTRPLGDPPGRPSTGGQKPLEEPPQGWEKPWPRRQVLYLGFMLLNKGGNPGINARLQRASSIPQSNPQVGITRQLFKLRIAPPLLLQFTKQCVDIGLLKHRLTPAPR